jgi:hypothetical protein
VTEGLARDPAMLGSDQRPPREPDFAVEPFPFLNQLGSVARAGYIEWDIHGRLRCCSSLIKGTPREPRRVWVLTARSRWSYSWPGDSFSAACVSRATPRSSGSAHRGAALGLCAVDWPRRFAATKSAERSKEQKTPRIRVDGRGGKASRRGVGPWAAARGSRGKSR